MHKTGERRYYPLAIMQYLLRALPGLRQGDMYDVGCSMSATTHNRKLFGDNGHLVTFATSVFHSFAHHWGCQLGFSPRLNVGWGLSDGEGLERLWSLLSPLIGPLRHANRKTRYQVLAAKLGSINEATLDRLAIRVERTTGTTRGREAQDELRRLFCDDARLTRDYLERQWADQRRVQLETVKDGQAERNLRLGEYYAVREQVERIEAHLRQRLNVALYAPDLESLRTLARLRERLEDLQREGSAERS